MLTRGAGSATASTTAPRPLFRQLLLRCSTFLRPCRSPDAVLDSVFPTESTSSFLGLVPPPSDRHGWPECKRIVGTILAMESCVVLTSDIPAGCLRCSTFRHLTARDGRSRTSCASWHLHVQVQWWKCKRIVGTILALSVARPRGCFCCGRCAGMHKCRERRRPAGMSEVRAMQEQLPGRAGATKVTKTSLPRGCYTGTYECREWRDPQERPSAVLFQWPACGAPLSLLSLATPGRAVRGKPVQRGEGSLDLRLYPLHPYPAPSRDLTSPSLIRCAGCTSAAGSWTNRSGLGSTEGAKKSQKGTSSAQFARLV
jgi:hypothetical protein